jgi:hypothetical protein
MWQLKKYLVKTPTSCSKNDEKHIEINTIKGY